MKDRLSKENFSLMWRALFENDPIRKEVRYNTRKETLRIKQNGGK